MHSASDSFRPTANQKKHSQTFDMFHLDLNQAKLQIVEAIENEDCFIVRHSTEQADFEKNRNGTMSVFNKVNCINFLNTCDY